MDADELADWRAKRLGACADCTVAFAEAQRSIGRCNGVPGELLAGAVEDEEEAMEAVADQPGRKVAVAVTAPCAGCIKNDVCALRPVVEQMRTLPVTMPVLDPLLGVELAGTVTCSAFVKAPRRKVEDQPEQPAARRTLILSPEERERRRRHALAMVERQRAAREAAAS